jgi:hypothetical protein
VTRRSISTASTSTPDKAFARATTGARVPAERVAGTVRRHPAGAVTSGVRVTTTRRMPKLSAE